jgi:hypothetical protein
MLFTSAMPTHAGKNRGRRVLFPLKRANTTAPFGLYAVSCMIAQLAQLVWAGLDTHIHNMTYAMPTTGRRPITGRPVLGAATQAYEPSPRPAAAGTGEGQRSQPRCRSGSPATKPSGPGAKLDPPEHTQPIPAPPWTQGANGGQYFVQLKPG